MAKRTKPLKSQRQQALSPTAIHISFTSGKKQARYQPNGRVDGPQDRSVHGEKENIYLCREMNPSYPVHHQSLY